MTWPTPSAPASWLPILAFPQIAKYTQLMPCIALPRLLLVAIAACSLTLSSASAQLVALGTIGDSLTDEYSEESYNYAANWTLLLAQHRAVNLGSTAAIAAQPGNSWGEPRRTGFAFNWARFGADSSTAISDGQVTGLAAQVQQGAVSHAVVAIGANDYSPTTGAYFSLYWGLWSTAQTNSYVSSQVADIRATIDALQSPGAKVVLGNVLDFGIAPVTRSIYTNASRRQRVADAIALENRQLVLLARQKRIVFLDLSRLAQDIFGSHAAPRTSLIIGGVSIDLTDRDTSTHSRPLAGFVDDGAHPHTSIQGLFANIIAAGLNVHPQVSILPFTEADMLSNAGIAYVGPDTLASQIAPSSSYVRDYRCPANFNGVGDAGVQDVFDFLTAWFSSQPEADINFDSTIGVQDIFDFLSHWFAACP